MRAAADGSIQISLQTAWIAIKVFPGTELQRIHEHTDKDRPLTCRPADQRTVAVVEATHGGNELDVVLLVVAPAP